MNLFQLVLKQMRQRALSTSLTLLTIVLGVSLAIAVMILHREAGSLFGQSDFGYELIVGSKGSSLQLVVNTVYHMDKSPGNIPWGVYEQLRGPGYRSFVKAAVPFSVGDTCKGYRVLGTLPELFGAVAPGQYVMEHSRGKRYEFAAGKPFAANRFEAILGSEMAEKTGTKIGDLVKVTHDAAVGKTQGGHVHDENWKVVGILKPTHTANDRVVFVPLASLIALGEHSESMRQQGKIRGGANVYDRSVPVPAPAPTSSPAVPASAPPWSPWIWPPVGPATAPAQDHDHDHDHDHAPATTQAVAKPAEHHDHDHDHDHDHAPATTQAIATPAEHHDEDGHDHADHAEPYTKNSDGSFIVTLPQADWMISGVMVKTRSDFAVGALSFQINNTESAMAANPAMVMREFFNNFLHGPSMVLLAIACLVTVVAAVGILVSIYNAVAARLREIAILRALGATRLRVLAMICLEAAMIGLAGGLIGFVIGHLIAGIASGLFEARIGQGINWLRIDWYEPLYLLAVTATAAIAGLVPALKAYRTPVATNLVAV